MSHIHPFCLRCEHLADPLGIDAVRPRLGWVLQPSDVGGDRAGRQTAYRILVATTPDILARHRGDLWDTGKVASDEQLHIEYGGKPLSSRQRCYWKVRVWDDKGRSSAWSEPGRWSVGLLAQSDWQAKWIGESIAAPWVDTGSRPSPCLRKAFVIEGAVRSALVYVSALGLYELRLNGRRVGDRVLAPEWTDYHKRLQYQTYDVARWLRSGENVLGATLAQGWYAGQLGLSAFFPGGGRRGFYGQHLRLLLRLEIETADGKKHHIVSDEGWRYTVEGAIRGADLLDGEMYDARRELTGWDAPGFDDATWQAVDVCDHGPRLVAQPNEPIRITEEIQAVTVGETGRGVYVFDLGQNMVGWVRLRLRGKAGTTLTVRHAEVLNPDGTIYRDNLRLPPVTPVGAQQEDHYVCRGAGEEVFEPRFTYHGFRYVEVTGLDDRPLAGDLKGCVVHSAASEVGRFECSSPLLNKIWSAIRWTQRGNLHSIPTDCPQRDERLGWMGDMQVFSQTACFNMDMAAFFTKWTRDIRDAQTDDGRFPDFAPQPYDPSQRFSANPGWGDAGVIIPWVAYRNYGDTRLLAEQFPAAKRWIEFVRTGNPDLIWRNQMGTGFTYGDWLNGDTFVGLPGWPKKGGEVPKEVYATAFFAYSTQLVACMAGILGCTDDSRKYGVLAKKIRVAFNREFVTSNARIRGDTQAGYALALSFDLLPLKLRPLAARHMVRALKPYRGGMSTGIQSTVRLMLELTRHGYHREAYALITRKTMPSWGYMVEHGGTTIWERWDGWVEKRGFQNPSMNSFNHYAIGAVGEWMYRVIGGINPDESAPGYKHFFIQPIPGGGLTWAKVSYESVRGLIRSEWRIVRGVFKLEVTVPCNTTATVRLPDQKRKPVRLGAGTHGLDCDA